MIVEQYLLFFSSRLGRSGGNDHYGDFSGIYSLVDHGSHDFAGCTRGGVPSRRSSGYTSRRNDLTVVRAHGSPMKGPVTARENSCSGFFIPAVDKYDGRLGFFSLLSGEIPASNLKRTGRTGFPAGNRWLENLPEVFRIPDNVFETNLKKRYPFPGHDEET